MGSTIRRSCRIATRGPEITSVEQPLYTIGMDSVRLLSQRLEGKGSQEPITKLYKTKLVVQETVGPCNE